MKDDIKNNNNKYNKQQIAREWMWEKKQVKEVKKEYLTPKENI